MKSWTIQKATLEDSAALARVQVDTWRTAFKGIMDPQFLDSLSYSQREARWRELIVQEEARSHRILARNPDSSVVGFSVGGANRNCAPPEFGEVYALYVLEEYQGQGIGKGLVLQSFQNLLRDCFTNAIIWVLEGNPNRRFYEAMGGSLGEKRLTEIGGKSLSELSYVWDLSTLELNSKTDHENQV